MSYMDLSLNESIKSYTVGFYLGFTLPHQQKLLKFQLKL